MSTGQRDLFLDKLRVAATCAVVLLHTVTGVVDRTDMGGFPWEKRVLLTVVDLVSWCVPVFLMISGYLFLNPKREITFGKMVTKYCRRVVFALFLFGVPYACLEQIALERTFRMDMPVQGVLMVLRGQSWSHMWYLYLIFFLYLLTPALRLLLGKLPEAGKYGLLGGLLVGSSVLPFAKRLTGLEGIPALPDDLIYLFYYLCGYLFAVRKPDGGNAVQDGAEKCPLPAGGRGRASGGLWLGAALLWLLFTGCGRLLGFPVQMAYNYPFTVVSSVLLFGGAWKCGSAEKTCQGKDRNTGFLESASAISFGVYLVHPVFLNLYYKFLGLTPLAFPLWLSLPLFFLGTLLPAAAAAYVMRKLPPFRKYVL
ncbi:MAG: acyltransferase [Acetatifactor sp.]|nr:acyltransferase [Acetatifactor sp.]